MTNIRHKVIFPILSMLIGLAAGLLLVELLLRVSGIAPAVNLHSVNSREFKRIPGIWQSNQDFVSTEKPTLPYRITINSIGYRGAEIPVKKADGELRILMIGDSMTFGTYVDNAETLPAQLEKHLRAKCGTKSIRVINAGIEGSTITSQAEMIRRGLVLEPDLVVLVFHENDIEELMLPLWPSMAHNRELKSRFPMNSIWPVLRNTATWNFAIRLQRWWEMHGTRSATVVEHTDDAARAEATFELRDLKARYQRALLRTFKLVRQRNTEFVFMLYPGPWSLKGKDWLKLIGWAELAGQSAGIPTFNLLAGMREGLSVIDLGYLLPHDIHPSPRGHEIAARLSAQFLLSREPLRAACS